MRTTIPPVLLVALCFIAFPQDRDILTLTGTISDRSTGELLAAANIRIAGTSRGTIANSQGTYALTLERGQHTIVYTYLGYEPETLRITLSTNLDRDVTLASSPIRLPEELVVAEDPAVGIIRKAIAKKRQWMDKLKSYRFEAFTRQTIRRDTGIASIMESYSTGYLVSDDTLREIIRQKRQTENIALDQNLAAVRSITNFNEDDINLFRIVVNDVSSSYTFVGPTSPEALDYYEYKLLNTKDVGGVEVYEIRMSPVTRLRPLFQGTIFVADRTFAVMGVDLQPNEAFALPFTKGLALRYRQEFALYDSIFWMPTNIRITSRVSISLVGLTMPEIGLDITSTIYDYVINVPIPDSIAGKRWLSVDSSTATFDSTFWKTRDVLPLTEEERTAYRTLDSSQTLEKQFRPRGVLMSLGDDNGEPLSALHYVDGRFNRVEGFFLGGKFDLDSVTAIARLHGSLGYGFSDDRTKYTIGGELFWTASRRGGIGVELYRKLDFAPDEGYYGPVFISFTSLIFKNDYRDYFLSKGWRVYIMAMSTRGLRADLSFLNEDHTSLSNATEYSLFSRGQAFRTNPQTAEGRLRSLRLDLHAGESPVPLGLLIRDALDLSIEYSSPGLARSAFSFMRVSGVSTWNITTFSRSLLFPQTLRLRISAGATGGTLPPQRSFTLETQASGYAPFGVLRGASEKEFVGDRFVMLNLEHNFRSVPFLALDLPFLFRNNIELILHGGIAQSWANNVTTSNGWYSEVGLGLSRILDFLRFDMSHRLSEPKRFVFTLAVASLF